MIVSRVNAETENILLDAAKASRRSRSNQNQQKSIGHTAEVVLSMSMRTNSFSTTGFA